MKTSLLPPYLGASVNKDGYCKQFLIMPSINEFVYTHVFKGFSGGCSCRVQLPMQEVLSVPQTPASVLSIIQPSVSLSSTQMRDLSVLKGNVALVPANAGDTRRGFSSWVGKIPWRRKWQPTPVFLPGESHGQRSLVDYSPQGRKESDTTEAT